jgi:hypothetical protein
LACLTRASSASTIGPDAPVARSFAISASAAGARRARSSALTSP